jgi:hypothetical protein
MILGLIVSLVSIMGCPINSTLTFELKSTIVAASKSSVIACPSPPLVPDNAMAVTRCNSVSFIVRDCVSIDGIVAPAKDNILSPVAFAKNIVDIFKRLNGVISIVSDIVNLSRPSPYVNVAELSTVGGIVSGISVTSNPIAATKLFPAKSLNEPVLMSMMSGVLSPID